MARALASDPALPAEPAGADPRPWCERAIERSGLTPAAFGAAVSGATLLAMLAAEVLSGELGRVWRGEAGPWKASEYRFSVILALLLGYLPAAWVWTVRGARRTFAELRPVLRGTPAELDAIAGRLGRFDRRQLRRIGVAGVVLGLAIPVATDATLAVYTIVELNTASLGHRLLVPLLMWLVARIAFAALGDARRLVTVTRERLELDLLDPAPLAPLTRHGLQNALISLGMISIVSLMLVDWASRPGMPWVLGLLIAAAVGVGITSLLLPLRGARSVIQRAKRRELGWCREHIRRRRDAIARGEPPSGEGSLDELVAYHRMVAEVRAWPFDAPTLVRLALYLAIPLGSWLGGAMVERLLDALLD